MPGNEELLMRAIRAHGGMDRWNPVKQISFRVKTSGLALASRLKPFAFKSSEVTVTARIPEAVFDDFPGDGQKGHFTRNSVKIIGRHGEVKAERVNPRESMKGLRRKLFWDNLDALYFGGYALWNYMNLPFLLWTSGFEVEEVEPWREGGNIFRRLRVKFPPPVPTHSEEQLFYFDDSGTLIRHDYTAEVFGRWAKAAHVSSRFKEFDGLIIPTRRQVFPRSSAGHPLRKITLVFLEIEDVRIGR